MKIFAALLLICSPLLGADPSIRVTSTTNVYEGTVDIDEVFTRNGQTNLTRHTMIESGRVTCRIHWFYHDDVYLAYSLWTAPPRSVTGEVHSDLTIYPASPYFFRFDFGPSNQINSASISTRETVIDSFSCTNGLFFPDDASRIAEANKKRGKSEARPNRVRESEADNVREVAFKTLIYEAAAAQQGCKVYFLSLGYAWLNDKPDIDPSDLLMKRFGQRTPPVKKGSQSKIGDKGEVRDKETGQLGVIFSVTDLKWISDQEVEATCGVFKAGLNSCTYKYTMIRKNNQWKVTNKQIVSIS